MNHLTDEQFGRFVRDAVAPMSGQELERDLWPQMRLKLGDPGINIRWFDLVLVAIVVAVCVSVPEAMRGLLYNL